MPTKRKGSKHLNLAPILLLLLLANVAVGVVYSPLTELQKIRVEGVPPDDQARVADDLKRLTGIPCAQIRPRETETRVQSSEEVDFADFTRNPFGSGVLKVTYRRPVAAMSGLSNVALAADGTMFRTLQPLGGLIEVALKPEELSPVATIQNNWPSQTVADLCERLARQPSSDKLVIEVDNNGRLCLNIGLARRIILGDSEKLDRKLDAWRRFADERPSDYSAIAELNLTAPEKPAYRLKPEVKN